MADLSRQLAFQTSARSARDTTINCSPRIIVVTGIMAAGKSTVSRLLTQRFARGAYVEADALQRMILSGGEWVSENEPGEPYGEAALQLNLRLKNACLLSTSFLKAGFTVVLDDIILGDRWLQLQKELRGLPFSLIVLAPRVDVILQRDANRSKKTKGSPWASYLDHLLHSTMEGIGFWINTSEQTPEESVETILQHLLNDESVISNPPEK